MEEEYLDPTDSVAVSRKTAARPSTLDGKVITLLDISKSKGDHLLDRIEELLTERARPRAIVRRRKPVRAPGADPLRQGSLLDDVLIEALRRLRSCTTFSVPTACVLRDHGIPNATVISASSSTAARAQLRRSAPRLSAVVVRPSHQPSRARRFACWRHGLRCLVRRVTADREPDPLARTGVLMLVGVRVSPIRPSSSARPIPKTASWCCASTPRLRAPSSAGSRRSARLIAWWRGTTSKRFFLTGCRRSRSTTGTECAGTFGHYRYRFPIHEPLARSVGREQGVERGFDLFYTQDARPRLCVLVPSISRCPHPRFRSFPSTSMCTCRRADAATVLRVGAALGEILRARSERVVLMASGDVALPRHRPYASRISSGTAAVLDVLADGRGRELAASRRGARQGGQLSSGLDHPLWAPSGPRARALCYEPSWASRQLRGRVADLSVGNRMDDALPISARQRLPVEPVPLRAQVRREFLARYVADTRVAIEEMGLGEERRAICWPATATPRDPAAPIPTWSSWPPCVCAWSGRPSHSSFFDFMGGLATGPPIPPTLGRRGEAEAPLEISRQVLESLTSEATRPWRLIGR